MRWPSLYRPMDNMVSRPLIQAAMKNRKDVITANTQRNMPETAEVPVRPTENDVVDVLRSIYDPEIPVNIYDLGLIYEIQVYDDFTVFVLMTLTSPNCPVAGILPGQVESSIKAMPGVRDARVKLTFEPPFTIEMMSEEARFALGFL